jgi:hypothetical protein
MGAWDLALGKNAGMMHAEEAVASVPAVSSALRVFASALPITIRDVAGTRYAGSTRVVSKVQR